MELRLNVNGKPEIFTFPKLDNKIKIMRLMNEMNIKYPDFLKSVMEVATKKDEETTEVIDVMESFKEFSKIDTMIEIICLFTKEHCTSHSLKNVEDIEDFFCDDFEALMQLLAEILGFTMKKFL